MINIAALWGVSKRQKVSILKVFTYNMLGVYSMSESRVVQGPDPKPDPRGFGRSQTRPDPQG